MIYMAWDIRNKRKTHHFDVEDISYGKVVERLEEVRRTIQHSMLPLPDAMTCTPLGLFFFFKQS